MKYFWFDEGSFYIILAVLIELIIKNVNYIFVNVRNVINTSLPNILRILRHNLKYFMYYTVV